jgi:cell division protein FtsL
VSRFLIEHSWKEFPHQPSDYAANPQIVKEDGWVFVSVGICFVFVAIFDAYSWVYHPFQRNILVDVNDKSEAEQMQLQALIQNESVIGNSSVHLGESFANLYNMIATSVDSKQGNSFVRVFEIQEFLHLLLSAAMFQTATFIVYDAHTEAE